MREDQIEILEKVYFDPGNARVLARSARLVSQIAGVIKSHAELVLIEVQGHTDSRGGKAMNVVLSQARAKAVVQALTRRGVAADRLVGRGYGPSRPVAPNATAQGREKNRRVEFRVLKRTVAGEVIEVE